MVLSLYKGDGGMPEEARGNVLPTAEGTDFTEKEQLEIARTRDWIRDNFIPPVDEPDDASAANNAGQKEGSVEETVTTDEDHSDDAIDEEISPSAFPEKDDRESPMGINPAKPTQARPGTEQKVLMLEARYAAGMPLWHDEDSYNHGPKETELMGASTRNSQATDNPGDFDDPDDELVIPDLLQGLVVPPPDTTKIQKGQKRKIGGNPKGVKRVSEKKMN